MLTVHPIRRFVYSDYLWLIALIMNAIIVALAWMELVPGNNGLPYDSAIYADMAVDFSHKLHHIKLDAYYIQRLFPSAIIGGAARLFHVYLSPSMLVNAFRMLDFLAINCAFCFIATSMRLVGVKARALLVTMILAFGNFCFLKYSLYYPALTDCCAIAIGSGLLYSYLKGRSWLIVCLGILGAFTHPLLLLAALGLFVFPLNRSKSDAGSYSLVSRWQHLLPYMAGLIYFLVCSALYVVAYKYISTRETLGTTHVAMRLYFLSVAVASLFIFIIARLAISLDIPRRVLSDWNGRHVLIAAAVFAFVKIIQSRQSVGPGPMNILSFGMNIITTSLAHPLVFIVAHITFFGPAVLLILLFWKRYQKQLSHHSTGYLIFLIGILMLAVNSESRQYGIAWAFIIVPLGQMLQEMHVSRRQTILLGISALVISKVWLPINHGPLEVQKDLRVFNQRLFLNMGPWMNRESYLIQGICFVLLAILFWISFRRRPERDASDPKAEPLRPEPL
jgi:hypothetical protein